jgi:hypothetical protein
MHSKNVPHSGQVAKQAQREEDRRRQLAREGRRRNRGEGEDEEGEGEVHMSNVLAAAVCLQND